MKRHMLIFVAALAMFSLIFAGGKEGKVTGIISGAHCGVDRMACDVTHDLARSELPGIFTKAKKFYTIVNIPQTFLAQFPIHEASVEGTVYDSERGIYAKKLSVKEGVKWQTVFENGYIVDGMGHKEKLSSAMEIDGKWFCADCATTHPKK